MGGRGAGDLDAEARADLGEAPTLPDDGEAGAQERAAPTDTYDGKRFVVTGGVSSTPQARADGGDTPVRAQGVDPGD